MTISRWKKIAIGGGSSIVLLSALVGYFEPSLTPGTPYKDVTGVWTNCDGNTHGVDPTIIVTPELCATINANNEKEALNSFDKLVDRPVTNNQRAAFTDIIYNIGEDKFKHSTMLRLINEGKVTEACKELLKWVYAGGKKLPGLVARRQAEYTICITPN